jgi:hypothetical protein
MKARRASRCTVCSDQIQVGDEIGAFLGKWVHAACKTADIARRAKAAGAPKVLPTAMPDNEMITYVATKRLKRRGLSALAGRDLL